MIKKGRFYITDDDKYKTTAKKRCYNIAKTKKKYI